MPQDCMAPFHKTMKEILNEAYLEPDILDNIQRAPYDFNITWNVTHKPISYSEGAYQITINFNVSKGSDTYKNLLNNCGFTRSFEGGGFGGRPYVEKIEIDGSPYSVVRASAPTVEPGTQYFYCLCVPCIPCVIGKLIYNEKVIRPRERPILKAGLTKTIRDGISWVRRNNVTAAARVSVPFMASGAPKESGTISSITDSLLSK